MSPSRSRNDELLGDVGQLADRLTAVADAVTTAADAELAGSTFCALWSLFPELSGLDVERVVGPRVVEALERRGDRRALAALRALQVGATTVTSRAAATAAERLAVPHRPEPSWWSAAQAIEPVAAAALRERVFDDREVVLVERALPDGTRDCVGVAIDRDSMGLAVDVALFASIDDCVEGLEDSAPTELEQPYVEPLDLREAKGRMLRALALASMASSSRERGDDLDDLRGLAEQRAQRIPGDPTADVRADDALDGVVLPLLERFLAAPEGADVRDDEAAEELVLTVAQRQWFVTLDGEPRRWTSTLVTDALEDLARRDSGIDLDILARAPDILASWVRFGGRDRGVSEAVTARALDAIEERRATYLEEIGRA